MSYSVILIPIAEADVLEAWHWYKNESPGLEQKFWDATFQTILQIAKHPSRFSLAKADIRVAFVKRFPYKIVFYTNEAMKRVEVVAILHKKRHPGIWQKRI